MILIKRVGNEITISGHAGYNNHGSDIVCASISSIMYTTVNALLRFDSKSISYNDDSKKVTIKILKDTHETNILITNMFALFQELANQYSKNIKIESEE